MVGFVALSVAPLGCKEQRVRDQESVRRLCLLPSASAATAWRASPDDDGWQREGLSVSGAFRTPSTWSPIAAGYHPLPWRGARAALERDFRLGLLLDDRGWARCVTAGNDLLAATSVRDCDGLREMNDVIVCVVEPQTARPTPLVVRVEARAKY
jgi:hypothetical protein